MCLSATAFGQPWSGILAPTRATDWSYAGIPGGIPDSAWANCVTTACNTLNSGTVTAASITAALASAPNNTVVRIPTTTTTLSGCASTNRSNVVLRGAGPQSTKLTGCLFFGTNGTGGLGSYPPSLVQTNWTGGLTTGSTVLTLASTTGIVAGQNIILDQLNAAWVFTTGVEGPCIPANSCGRSSSPLQFNGSSARAQPEMVTVVSVNSGTQITIAAPGIGFDHSSGLTPQAFFWNNGGSIRFAGVENLSLNANGNDDAISFPFCDYCWAKNVQVTNIARAGVFSWWSTHFELRDSYISASNTAGAPTEYGIEILATSYAKIENNILYGVTSPLLPETTFGIVAAYNYDLNSSVGNQFGSLETHLAHNFLSLYEGNSSGTLMYDNSWGSASQSTSFRNRANGNQPNKTNYRVAMKVNAHNHYMNLVGNVLGDPTYHTQYVCDDTHAQGSDNFVYDLGFFDRCEIGNTSYDTVTQSSLMRWGNWDAVTYCANGGHSGAACGATGSNGVRFCTGAGAGNAACAASETANTDPTFPGLASPSTTLPASFYTGATAHSSCGTGLSFWKNPATGICPPYPPMGPDVTGGNITNTGGHASKIPAQLCYENTAKNGSGFLTAFDANACYANDIGPAPPTGISGVVH